MALLPDETGAFVNYASYSNGSMVDMAGTPTKADFEFSIGNDDDTANWSPAPAPTSVTVRTGEGNDGSNRVDNQQARR